VLAGEVVARLESRDLQAMRDLAAANVQVAEANLGQGRAELLEAELAIKRSEALTAKQLTSEQEHDSAVARLAKAEAALEGYTAAVTVAKANLRISEVDLDQTLIRAPFDGVVLTRNANVGDTITPFSQAVDTKGAVVTIADMDTLEVEVDVAETFFLSIRVGQPVEIQLDAIPGLRFQGVVSLMVPTVDRAKASTVVKIRFVDPDPRILPEMSAKAAFLQRKVNDAERKPVLVVPVSAIAGSDGDEAVYVIEDGMARMREVDVGAKIGEQIEVLGLEVGIRVIKRPPEELSDGRMVIEDVE
jgi:RND family efflux transporter MFP subunit